MVETKDKNVTVTTEFKFKNETPGALRYDEVDSAGNIKKNDADGAIVATLYLRKAAMGGKVMKRFKMVLTEITE